MVRVMSVHHFTSQDIHTCEEPLAATTAPPDLLLLALPQHVIEVHNLAKSDRPSFTFPTVDEVHQMVHSCCGNYVATLERKVNRQGKESIFARIYANWDTSCSQEPAMLQPMRARIGGRVTPSSAQSSTGGLEMIELPTKKVPNTLICCQTTGNLLLASNKTLTIYYFQVRTHDISRQKFIDFEESSVNLELSFSPWKLQLCEDTIACMSKQHLHVLRLGRSEDRQLPQCSQETITPSVCKTNRESHLNWDEIIKEEFQEETPKDVTEVSWTGRSSPVVIELPDIASERSKGSNGCSGISETVHRHIPFQVAPQEMTVNVTCSSPTDVWAEENGVLNILQLQIPSSVVNGSPKQIYAGSEEFKCLLLKPIFIKESQGKKTTRDQVADMVHPMRSTHYSSLGGIICLVTTLQEGYLYYFSMETSHSSPLFQQAACITVYPFTAPVSSVVLENYLLHALTDTGLETYTMRVGHHLLRDVQAVDDINVASPTWSDPVCLVGLHPFLGVQHLLLSHSFLLLLACSESTTSSCSSHNSLGASWTLYSLQIPSPPLLYHDFVSAGTIHRWTSPNSYCHLLSEAHIILWTALTVIRWLPHDDQAIPYKDQEDADIILQLYRESCALLGDYHITSTSEEDWKLATPYYKMSCLNPIQVVERVRCLDIPEELHSDTRRENQTQGLMKYLKTCLLLMNQNASSVNFTPAIPSFTNTLLDLFEQHDPSQVSWLVLQSSFLREYATDRVLNIMKKQLSIRPVPNPSDAVALVLLCIQKGSPEQAVAVLNSISSSQLEDILLTNSGLLFDTTPSVSLTSSSMRKTERVVTFSELSVVLMDAKPELLASILFSLVICTTEGNMTLREILKVFLEYLPSRIGITGSTASFVLQIFLEKYFAWFFSQPPMPYDLTTVEALKILVRSYLSDLQLHELNNANRKKVGDANVSCDSFKKKIDNMKDNEECSSSILFSKSRLPFLQKMPPFSKKVITLQKGEKETEEIDIKPQNGNKQENESLTKLQAVLCSGKLPKECIVEIYQFVQSHPQLHGNLSLQVLCLPAREGSNMLLNFCPQVLLQFAKDKFVTEAEWKYLLLLLQRKIYALPEDSVLKSFYQQVMKECLAYLSAQLSLEEFCRILPPGSEVLYQHFVCMCQQVSHANHILSLIIATGQQLLSTLQL
ncbi:BLOC-2 complex member HPS3 isoform X2 [Anabrus simplex]